jgi:hypothetical protein
MTRGPNSGRQDRAEPLAGPTRALLMERAAEPGSYA